MSSQYEVIELLGNNKGKWYCAKDLADQLKINRSSANALLKKVRKLKLNNLKYRKGDTENTGRHSFFYTIK